MMSKCPPTPKPNLPLLSSAQRETENAGIVLAVLGYWETKIQGDGHLPEKREGQPESKPHARTDCTELQFAIHGARIEKRHAAQHVAGQREVYFDRAGGHEIAANRVVSDAGTG